MEVAGDGRVFVLPSNPSSFRQQRQRSRAPTAPAGNGASMLVSVHNGTVPVPNFFGTPSNVLKLHPQNNVSGLDSFLEYVGA